MPRKGWRCWRSSSSWMSEQLTSSVRRRVCGLFLGYGPWPAEAFSDLTSKQGFPLLTSQSNYFSEARFLQWKWTCFPYLPHFSPSFALHWILGRSCRPSQTSTSVGQAQAAGKQVMQRHSILFRWGEMFSKLWTPTWLWGNSTWPVFCIVTCSVYPKVHQTSGLQQPFSAGHVEVQALTVILCILASRPQVVAT